MGNCIFVMVLYLNGAMILYNERIKKLIDQSTTIEEYGWGASYANFDKEKFAELIIKECIHACIADIADPRDTIELRCAKKIKEHFGVG